MPWTIPEDMIQVLANMSAHALGRMNKFFPFEGGSEMTVVGSLASSLNPYYGKTGEFFVVELGFATFICLNV